MYRYPSCTYHLPNLGYAIDCRQYCFSLPSLHRSFEAVANDLGIIQRFPVIAILYLSLTLQQCLDASHSSSGCGNDDFCHIKGAWNSGYEIIEQAYGKTMTRAAVSC